jgi:putative FmdB family regulatory protein
MPLYDYKCGEGHRFERMLPLARYSEPQTCDCGASARKLLCAPRILSDAIPPTYGADGKLHDSLSSYRHSMTPEGNPQGERYNEVERQQDARSLHTKPNRKQIRDDIERSIAEVKQGRRVAPVELEGAQ